MKKQKMLFPRAVLAVLLLVTGVYLFVSNSHEWYEKGLPVLTNGEKGKDAFSGVVFSIFFIAYGIWELFNIKNKARKR